MRLLRLVLALTLVSCGRSGDAPPRAIDAGADASAAAGADAAAPDGGPAAFVRVFDPGREPRVLTRFAFVPGRAEAAVLVIDSELTLGARTLQQEHVELRLGVRYPATDTVELTLARAETTAHDIPRVASTAGTRFTQKLYDWGPTELPEVTFPPGADPRAAEYVRGAVIQIASNLLPVLPADPIGDGARWAHNDLLFSSSPPGKLLVVERRSGIHGPRQLDTGETVLVHEEQTYRMEAAPDGIARHVEALLVAEQPGGTTRTTRLRLDVTGGP